MTDPTFKDVGALESWEDLGRHIASKADTYEAERDILANIARVKAAHAHLYEEKNSHG
jgi:hypothetical protein